MIKNKALLIPLLLAIFLSVFSTGTIDIALDTIAKAFDVSHADVTGLLTAFMLAFALFLPVFGILGDRLGNRTILTVGLLIYMAGSIAAVFAGDSYNFLRISIIIQGIGAGSIPPNTMGIIVKNYSTDVRGGVFGVWAGSAGLAAVIGPLIGGCLIQRLGWQSIFIANVPLVLITMLFIFIYAPRAESISRTGDLGVLVFVLKTKTFWACAGTAALQLFGFTAILVLNPLMMQGIHSWQPGAAGTLLLLAPLGMTIGTPIGGKLSDWRGPRWIPLAGGLFLGLSCIGHGLFCDEAGFIAIPLFLVGFFFGLTVAPLAHVVTGLVPPEKVTKVGGLFAMMRFFGGAIGATAAGRLLIVGPWSGSETAYGSVAIVVGLIVILSVFTGIGVKPKSKAEINCS